MAVESKNDKISGGELIYYAEIEPLATANKISEYQILPVDDVH